jgi:SEC-C motif-containing protein
MLTQYTDQHCLCGSQTLYADCCQRYHDGASAGSPDWAALRILDSKQAGDTGQVHFQAIYQLHPGWGYLQERSQFVREDGRWYYLRGEPHEGVLKLGRNEPCTCRSGRKFKACCL